MALREPTKEELEMAGKMKLKVEKDDARELRKIFDQRIEEIDPDRKAGLALSGGTDSTTILFAMLASGRHPRCYTFHVKGIESTDLLAARNLCKHFDLELVELVLPDDPDEIAKDIFKFIDKCRVIKKTVVQCMHPWLYLYPAMRDNGDILVLNGLGGDDLYANQRKINVAAGQHGEAAVIQWRKVFSDDMNFSAGNIMAWGREDWGITNIDFYNHPDIEKWFLKFPIRALHRPIEKYPSIEAYADYYRMGSFYRKHSSYQINSGLKKCHERLLDSRWNARESKDVIAIYNDFWLGRI